MKLILLGPPASGKGTQTKLVTEKFNIPHVSTGDILRDNIARHTEIGEKAKSYMDAGGLVPDDVVIEIIRNRLVEDDCKEGFVLDGFPRNLNQAKELEEMLNRLEKKLDAVIYLVVSEDELLERITGRRVCLKCGATFNVHFAPPKKEDICDRCGDGLVTRPDDNRVVFERRLEEYKAQTKPLIEYYGSAGLLRPVECTGTIEENFEFILKVLGV